MGEAPDFICSYFFEMQPAANRLIIVRVERTGFRKCSQRYQTRVWSLGFSCKATEGEDHSDCEAYASDEDCQAAAAECEWRRQRSSNLTLLAGELCAWSTPAPPGRQRFSATVPQRSA